jgi:hypothetical protein
MQPPAQVVTLFVCPASLVDLINMAQATCDPRGPHICPPCCSVRKKNRGLIDGCPMVQLRPSTTSLVRGSMVARTALATFTAALRCTTRCRHIANMSTSQLQEHSRKHFRTPLSPLRCPSPAPPTFLPPSITLTLSVSQSHEHCTRTPPPRTAPPRPGLPHPRRPILARNISADITSAHNPFV